MAGTRARLARDRVTMLPRQLGERPSSCQAATCQVTTSTRDTAQAASPASWGNYREISLTSFLSLI